MGSQRVWVTCTLDFEINFLLSLEKRTLWSFSLLTTRKEWRENYHRASPRVLSVRDTFPEPDTGSENLFLPIFSQLPNEWLVYYSLWRRKWQPTPVVLPGKFHGQRSPAGYTPRGHKESDTTGRLTHAHCSLSQGVWDHSLWGLAN